MSRASRWPMLIVLAAGVAGLMAVWIIARENGGATGPAPGGVYVEGMTGQPQRINPLFASFNEADESLSRLVFSGLVRLGPSALPEPDLAESWDILDEGRRYVFHLRRGLLWHDGEPLTASDVLFTFQSIREPGFRGDPALAALFSDVTLRAPDPLTVEVTLPEPFAPFLSYASIGIVPRHLLEGLSADALFDAPFNQRPIGSGPYRLESADAATAVLVASDTYHFGRPYLERIELRFYRDNAELLSALRNRELDGAFFRPGLSEDDRRAIEEDRRFDRAELLTDSYTLIYLNRQGPVFQDRKVRRALSLALDRDRLLAVALNGEGRAADSPVPKGLWGYFDTGASPAYDPEQAELLLDEAGWVREDGGTRAKMGETLHIALSTNDDSTRMDMAEEIASMWRAIGVAVDVEIEGASAFVQDRLLPRRFEAALFGIETGPDPDEYAFWHSSQRAEGGRNLADLADPDVDFALERGRKTTDLALRAQFYILFQQAYQEEFPAILLLQPARSYVTAKELRGQRPVFLYDAGARFYDVHRWYVRTQGGG
jgi:peptide/nickel transport system substrate-binding protein